jgi:hypothetical protein
MSSVPAPSDPDRPADPGSPTLTYSTPATAAEPRPPDVPPTVTGGAAPSVVDAAAPARRLGDSRILREIGRGGMGTVFEAVQAGQTPSAASPTRPAAATSAA